MERKRKIIEIDEERCDGCGQCVLACAEGAIEIIDGKARIVKDSYCDGLGACLGECPQGALRIIEREADEFDPEAVEKYLESKQRQSATSQPFAHAGCPSAQVHLFQQHQDPTESVPLKQEGSSALRHWPVQIRLVPPDAPFLKGADLLVAADCAPVAYPHFHADFLQGKAVMLGCPKFDDVQEYVSKFTEIFRKANIKSITVVDMEVPCCSALPMIVKKALEGAHKDVSLEEVTVSVKGEVLRRKHLAT